MSREAFHLLLRRYLEGNCTSEEKRIVEQWYGMLDKHDLPELPESSFTEIEQRLWERVRPEVTIKPAASTTKPAASAGKIRSSWVRISAVAAAVVLAFMLAFYMQRQSNEPDFLREKAIVQTGNKINRTGHKISVLLEDGSRVVLKPGASLTFPRRFSADKREVFLKGEAFFEISKNPRRPFLVYNDDVIIRVVGTSFTVKPDKFKHTTEVAVSSGRVVVTEKGHGISLVRLLLPVKKAILTPNQKAVYTTGEGELQTALVTEPVLLLPERTSGGKSAFVFNEAPISQVFNVLEKAYGISISTDNRSLDHCTFTGDISGHDLYSKLELVCQTVRASYEVKGVEIVVNGKGCN